MKKAFIYLTLASVFTAACDDTQVVNLAYSEGNSAGSSNTNVEYSSSDGAYDVRNFTVDANTIDESTFVDDTENTANISEDDLVEKSSFGNVVTIVFEGNEAKITNDVKGVTITADGAHVTVTSKTAGVEYSLSGSSDNGQFKLYSEKKSKITLDNLSLTNTTGSAINIQSKKRTFVVLGQGTSNKLVDGNNYTTVEGEDEKGTIFAEGELIFSGTGALNVTANKKHGICSDQYIATRAGVYINVNSVKDGFHSNDGFVQNGGIIVVNSSDGDCIECESNIDIFAGLLKLSTTGTASKGIKSDANISICGGKQLIITSGDAEYDTDAKDMSSAACVKCDTTLTITGGEMHLKSTGTGGKGFNVGDKLTINDGTIYIVTEGARYSYGSSSSNNNRGPWGGSSSSDDTTSSPKGMKITGDINITGGKIRVRTLGASEGSEGIESKSKIYISGGDIAVYTADDAFNATSHIEISGGSVYAYATNNDGIDSNGTLTIKGGIVVSSGTTAPEEGFDCDQNTFSITGGTIVGTGGATSTPTTSQCTQNVVIYGLQAASGAVLTIVDSEGNHILSYTVPRAYSSMSWVVSSSKLVKGTYTVYYGGTLTGGNEYNGLVTDAKFEGGTELKSFTISGAVTSVGNTSGGMGGGPGGGGPGFNW